MLRKQQQVALVTILIMLSIIPAYKFKSRMGVNVLPGPHTPNLVERLTGGMFKARWVDRNWFRRPQMPFNS